VDSRSWAGPTRIRLVPIQVFLDFAYLYLVRSMSHVTVYVTQVREPKSGKVAWTQTNKKTCNLRN